MKTLVLEVDDQHILKVEHHRSMTKDLIFQEFHVLLALCSWNVADGLQEGRIDCCLYRSWVNRFCVSTEALPNQSTSLEEFVLSLGNKTRKHIYQTKPLSRRIERQQSPSTSYHDVEIAEEILDNVVFFTMGICKRLRHWQICLASLHLTQMLVLREAVSNCIIIIPPVVILIRSIVPDLFFA